MTTPAEIIRYALLKYPSLYPCPLAVCQNLFTVVGHGYAWDINGNLVNNYPTHNNDGIMRYDDLNERRKDLHERQNMTGLDSLHLSWKLELDSDYIQRKFVEDNIDDIINADPLLKLFEYRPSRYGFIDNVSVNNANAFTFPDNITKEWAKVLNQFFGHWQVCLNQEYGCSAAGPDYWRNWPEHAIQVRNAIVEGINRLKPVLYGPDWENILAKREAMVANMIAELKKEP